MELPVAIQGGEFLTAVLLGLALSVVYDLLRGVRRLQPRLTWLLDLVFGLLLLVGALWYMLYPGGGRFRLHGAVGLWLGALVWFLSVSRWFCWGGPGF